MSQSDETPSSPESSSKETGDEAKLTFNVPESLLDEEPPLTDRAIEPVYVNTNRPDDPSLDSPLSLEAIPIEPQAVPEMPVYVNTNRPPDRILFEEAAPPPPPPPPPQPIRVNTNRPPEPPPLPTPTRPVYVNTNRPVEIPPAPIAKPSPKLEEVKKKRHPRINTVKPILPPAPPPEAGDSE